MDSLSTLPEHEKLGFQQSSLLESGISSVDSGSLSVGKHIAGLRHHVAALPHSGGSASCASASQLSSGGASMSGVHCVVYWSSFPILVFLSILCSTCESLAYRASVGDGVRVLVQ